MANDGYEGGSTPGGKWGCLGAALIGTPIFMVLLIVDALGDCAPDIPCSKGFWQNVFLPSAVIAVLVGSLVRWGVNAVRKDDRFPP